ncbi:MAG: hypothetical protein QXN92_06410 [Archaeoglobaceae archaeon]
MVECSILIFPNENDLKSVEKTLKLLKITELAWRRLEELSGGQRQKVFLAFGKPEHSLIFANFGFNFSLAAKCFDDVECSYLSIGKSYKQES